MAVNLLKEGPQKLCAVSLGAKDSPLARGMKNDFQIETQASCLDNGQKFHYKNGTPRKEQSHSASI